MTSLCVNGYCSINNAHILINSIEIESKSPTMCMKRIERVAKFQNICLWSINLFTVRVCVKALMKENWTSEYLEMEYGLDATAKQHPVSLRC